MVSHPDENRSRSRPPPSRQHRSSVAPQSVVSSRSSTIRGVRHSRYSKSHAGILTPSSSSSASSSNDFPIYTRSGDVEIVLVSGRKEARYLLHKLYLAQSSGWFEEVLGLGDSGTVLSGGSSSSIASVGQRVRFELDQSKADASPMLVLKPNSPRGFDDSFQRPPAIRPKPEVPNGFFRTMSNFSALTISQSHDISPDDVILRTYDNLFRTFYNHAPLIDTNNLAAAYSECKALLQLASKYEAIAVIGPRVDHHLLGFGSRLWKQIAKYPPSYLKLGYLARSRTIFREALIHVVGQWPAGESQLRGQVPQDVIHLIEDKVDEIDEMRQRVEGRLWRLSLTTSRGEKVAPGVAWLDWLVVSLWRQWFAEQTTPAPVGILKDGTRSRSSSAVRDKSSMRGPRGSSSMLSGGVSTAKVYRALGVGGSAYLGHDEVKRFLKLSPELYSRDNLRRAERRLEEMKNLAKDAVQPLTRNFLELDTTREGNSVSYLTCVKVMEGDWPWDD